VNGISNGADCGYVVQAEDSSGTFAAVEPLSQKKGNLIGTGRSENLCFQSGGTHGALKRAIEVLELALLRGTRPQAGSGGLARDFGRFRAELAKLRRSEPSSLHAMEPRARLRDEDLDQAQALIAKLQTALLPLESLASSKPYDFAELALRHREILAALSCDQDGVAAVFEERAGAALASAFDDLGEHTLKNIAKPVRVYRAGAGGTDVGAAQPVPASPEKPSRPITPTSTDSPFSVSASVEINPVFKK